MFRGMVKVTVTVIAMVRGMVMVKVKVRVPVRVMVRVRVKVRVPVRIRGMVRVGVIIYDKFNKKDEQKKLVKRRVKFSGVLFILLLYVIPCKIYV